ncbi:AMP-binding protein [Sphingomonas sp. PAMC 26621]|uniref:AMP-binding protein n=1 Tax=Sphingomonas sp. PAMC 26621 TaxID=1112213 RepID=UPI00028A398D|nr:AMP-binding protein [Sphingomonas sp. PAMC 26621]
MNGSGHKPHSTLFSRASILQLVCDLLATELARSRGRSSTALGAVGWNEATILGEGGLDLDSLERLDASSALSEFFHLSDYGAEDYLLTLPKLGDWCDLVAQSLTVGSARLTFRTSGSTGVPKRCTHAVADLAEEVASWAHMLGTVERIVSLVPSHHIYGTLFNVLLPDRLDIDVQRARGGVATVQRSKPGTLVIANPTLWTHLARSCPALPRGLIGISSTAPMPQALAEQLVRQGLDQMIEIYGSSETGGLGYRLRPDIPYTLLDFWRHLGNGEVVRHGVDGLVRHMLMDHSTWYGDRNFQLEGRKDFAVQVGGTNVFPERVRDMLLQHHDVVDAAVRLEPTRGRLKAFIVLRGDRQDDVSIEHIDSWCGTCLTDVERPRSFTIGREIPRDPMGKLADW